MQPTISMKDEIIVGVKYKSLKSLTFLSRLFLINLGQYIFPAASQSKSFVTVSMLFSRAEMRCNSPNIPNTL